MHLSYIYVYNLFIMLSYVHDIEKDETAKKATFPRGKKLLFFITIYILHLLTAHWDICYLGLFCFFHFTQNKNRRNDYTYKGPL